MTPKQFSYLRDLLIRRGHAHPTHGLRSSGRKFCRVPSSATSWDALRRRLSAADASRVIDQLK